MYYVLLYVLLYVLIIIIINDEYHPVCRRLHIRHETYLRACVCVFIKLHITTQSGPVILVILCHSH